MVIGDIKDLLEEARQRAPDPFPAEELIERLEPILKALQPDFELYVDGEQISRVRTADLTAEYDRLKAKYPNGKVITKPISAPPEDTGGPMIR